MFYLPKIFVFLFVLFLVGCNKNLTEEEKKELWSNAQTTGQIIERSGTVFNSGTNKDLAMRDATTRLQTGGGLFGKKGLSLSSKGLSIGSSEGKSKQIVQNEAIGMPINPYLWKASLETISFMPLTSSDPFGGTIITDWYTSASNENERCKLNIFINGSELKTENLKVSSFCQIFKNQKWINTKNNVQNDIKIENAILNKAKKIRLKTG